MIDALEVEMYPAFLVQQVIDKGIKDFVPRYIAFQEEHTSTLVGLMRLQNDNLLGQELKVHPLWEFLEKKKINPTVRI